MKDLELAELRREYAGQPLRERDMPKDPVEVVRRWVDEAIRAGLKDATAMTLSTTRPDGAPDARIVLLKGIEDGQLVFYSSYASAKGQQLDRDPRAALVFHWAELERQVRIRGRVERVPRAMSEAYFQTRPRGSQLAASASLQSAVVASREELETRFAAAEARFLEPGSVPTPPEWGGFALKPHAVELWHGRASRLHDRLLAEATDTGWQWSRLAP